MAEIRGFLRRQEGAKLPLYFLRFLQIIHQSHAIAQADTVGVHHYAAGQVIDVPQQQVCGLAPHAGETQQVLHAVRHASAIVGQEHPAGQHDVPGLGPVKAAGMYIRLYLLRRGFGEGLQRRETGKQRRSHQIDPGVCTLGAEAHGDHQLIILFILQRAQRLGVFRLQGGENAGNLFARSHGTISLSL